MCEANVYMLHEGHERLLIESVDTVEPKGDNTWRLVSIFGDEMTIRGRITGMNLVNHKILFEMHAD